MNDRELIRDVGTALYGEHWLTPLAAELSIDSRTVRRWAAGQREMPTAVQEKLWALVRERIRELERLL